MTKKKKKYKGFQVSLPAALKLAKTLRDRPTAEDAEQGAKCIESMIRELHHLRGEGDGDASGA